MYRNIRAIIMFHVSPFPFNPFLATIITICKCPSRPSQSRFLSISIPISISYLCVLPHPLFSPVHSKDTLMMISTICLCCREWVETFLSLILEKKIPMTITSLQSFTYKETVKKASLLCSQFPETFLSLDLIFKNTCCKHGTAFCQLNIFN